MSLEINSGTGYNNYTSNSTPSTKVNINNTMMVDGIYIIRTGSLYCYNILRATFKKKIQYYDILYRKDMYFCNTIYINTVAPVT